MEPLALAMSPVSDSVGLLVLVPRVAFDGRAWIGFEATDEFSSRLPSSSILGANSFRVKTLSLSYAMFVKSDL